MRRSTLFLILFLGLMPCGRSSASTDLNSLWVEAMQAEAHQAPTERVRRFSDWIGEAEKQGVRSSEAHYHLAMAQWESRAVGKAVFHLLESAKLRQNPFKALSQLSKIHQIESEQSVREGLSSSPSLYLYLFLTPNLVFFFGLVAAWCVILAAFLWWYRGEKVTRSHYVLAGVAVVSVCFPIAHRITHTFLLRAVAVTETAEGKSLGVFQNAEAKEDTKIISLPAGILVAIDEKKGNWSRISQPLSGWVESQNLIPVDLKDR